MTVAPRPSAVEAYFDSVAETYDTARGAGWYRAHAEMLLKLAGDLPPRARLLDIGCATGHLLRRAAHLNPGIAGIGIDVSRRMVEMAQNTSAGLPGLRFLHHDWEQPEDSEQADWVQDGFDLITCLSCAHYFAAPEEAFRRMRSMLRPGGRLLLLERDQDGSPATTVLGLLHRHILRDGVRFYGAAGLVKMLRKAGFRQAEVSMRLRRFAWKGKLVTSLAIVSARAD
ncbi:MAG TPA: methyltransferase domain-containing protein [Falsiroseomonas sp.]|jgi:SAM-dependent methyltransferase|nr:methyltransferase domain-containing protein [Falsiroseomonas sp.]